MTARFSRWLLVLTVFATLWSATAKKRHEEEEEDDFDDHEEDEDDFIDTLVGWIVLGIIITIVFGIISLLTWLACCCKDRTWNRRKVGQQDKRMAGLTLAPRWSRQLVKLPQYNLQGFSKTSDGIDNVDLYHVIRTRRSINFTDGARWDVPMTSGKHVFEVIWPWAERGQHSTVGVGTEAASLKVKGQRSLVGNDSQSWGLDISRRRAVHHGKVFGKRCPPDGSYVPDKFLMYVDMDAGKLSFGNDVTFWGDAINGLPTGGHRPVYVMVGTDKWRGSVRVYYKGSADPNVAWAETDMPMTSRQAAGLPGTPPPAYVEMEPIPKHLPPGTPATPATAATTSASTTPSYPQLPPATPSYPQHLPPLPATPSVAAAAPGGSGNDVTSLDLHPDHVQSPPDNELYHDNAPPPPYSPRHVTPAQGTTPV